MGYLARDAIGSGGSSMFPLDGQSTGYAACLWNGNTRLWSLYDASYSISPAISEPGHHAQTSSNPYEAVSPEGRRPRIDYSDFFRSIILGRIALEAHRSSALAGSSSPFPALFPDEKAAFLPHGYPLLQTAEQVGIAFGFAHHANELVERFPVGRGAKHRPNCPQAFDFLLA